MRQWHKHARSWPMLAVVLLLISREALSIPGRLQAQATGRSAAAPSLEQQIGGKSLAEWVRQVADTSPTRRREARRVFLSLGTVATAAIPGLVELLHRPSADTRASAAGALGNIGRSARVAVPELIGVLTDSSPVVRESAAEALGDIGSAGRPAVPILVRLLDDPEPGVRNEAAYAIGGVGFTSLEAVRALMRLVASEDSTWIRASAARALGRIGPKAKIAVQPLAVAVTDSAADLAAAAAVSLSRILGPRAAPAYAVIEDSLSLRADSRGPYLNGDRGVQAGVDHAATICTDWRSCSTLPESPPPVAGPRSILLDLSKPIRGSGGRSLGIIKAAAMNIGAFWGQDTTRRVVYGGIEGWELRTLLDLPEDSTVASDRTELRFFLDGVQHILQLGPWVAGQYQRQQGRYDGEGTTRALVTRTGPGTWIVRVPSASRARLWHNGDPAHPRDLGLYELSFTVRFESLQTR